MSNPIVIDEITLHNIPISVTSSRPAQLIPDGATVRGKKISNDGYAVPFELRVDQQTAKSLRLTTAPMTDELWREIEEYLQEVMYV